MKMLAVLWAAIFSACAMAAPDAGRLPPIVRSGFTQYKSDGAQAAVTAWMVGSPIALGDQPERVVHALRQFEDRFGAYQDFHAVRIVTISPTTQMIYLQLDYLNGPAFGKFLVYQARENAWNIVSFSFGADPEALWGYSLFGAPDVL
jgi:hypothetical protein